MAPPKKTTTAPEEDSTISSNRGDLPSDEDAARELPALTIIWHPRAERIGETALLNALASPGGSVAVSRLAPLFSRRGDTSETPLADRHLSRSSPAAVLAARSTGALELRLTDGHLPAAPIVPSATVRITAEEIREGVVFTLANRIVLCLHKARVPRLGAPAMGLLGSSDEMESVREMVERIADLDVPVLIRGETGSGKEMVARAIAGRGRAQGRGLLAINMAAVPTSTAAAELFGYERGAFTGATGARPGYFGEAAGGTIFLDEIGLAPQDVQAMLLRVLENREMLPVGASRPRPVNVRVLAATDTNLEDAIAEKRFSEPLFQRLAGFQITIPPLRRRRPDFGGLFRHFLHEELVRTGETGKLTGDSDDESPWIEASRVAEMAVGTWPGNVRALRNAARQIVIASRGDKKALLDEAVWRLAGRGFPEPAAAAGKSTESPAAAARRPEGPGPESVSPDRLIETLREHHWRPTATAAALGISRSTLYALIDQHPGIRKASAIPATELMSEYEATRGDLDALAERLQVSRRALQLRLRQVLSDRDNVGSPPARPRR